MSRNPRSISPTTFADTERQQQTRISAPRIFIFGAGAPNWCRDSAALSLLGLFSEIGLRWFATDWKRAESYPSLGSWSRSSQPTAPGRECPQSDDASAARLEPPSPQDALRLAARSFSGALGRAEACHRD